jgi:hypothetical protein
MDQECESKKQTYYRRSRRAAWWAAGGSGVLGVISIAEGPFDQGFGTVCLAVALTLFVWGLDYHRRLLPAEVTRPL